MYWLANDIKRSCWEAGQEKTRHGFGSRNTEPLSSTSALGVPEVPGQSETASARACFAGFR